MMIMDVAVQLSLFDDLARAPGTPSPGRQLPPRAQYASERIGAWTLTGLPSLPDVLQPDCHVLTTHGERLTLIAIMPHHIGTHDCWRLVLRSDDASAPWSIVSGVRNLPNLGLTTPAGRDLLPLCEGLVPSEGDDHGETLFQPHRERRGPPAAITLGERIHQVMPDGTSAPVVVLGRRGPWLLVRTTTGGQDLLHVSQTTHSPIASLEEDDAQIMGPNICRTSQRVTAVVGDWLDERATRVRAALEASCQRPASDSSAWIERHTHWQHLYWLRTQVGQEPTAADRALLVREISLGADVMARLEPAEAPRGPAREPTVLTITLTQHGQAIASLMCTAESLLDAGGSTDPQACLVHLAEQLRTDASRRAGALPQNDVAAAQAMVHARARAMACAEDCLATLRSGALPATDRIEQLDQLATLSNDALASHVLHVLRHVQEDLTGSILEVSSGIWTAVMATAGGVDAYGAVSSTGFRSHAMTGSEPAHLRHLYTTFLQEDKKSARQRPRALASDTIVMSERARARVATALADGLALATDTASTPDALFAWMGRADTCIDLFPRPTDSWRVLGGLIALLRARLESAVAQASQDVRLVLFRRPGEWDEACSLFSKPLVMLLVDDTWHSTDLRSLTIDLDEAVALARVMVAADITHDDR